MNKLVAFCLLATLAVFADAQVAQCNDGVDLCHKCELMVNQCYSDFNNDFSQTSDAQLEVEVKKVCKACFTGFQQIACNELLDQNIDRILQALRAHTASHQVCVQAGVC